VLPSMMRPDGDMRLAMMSAQCVVVVESRSVHGVQFDAVMFARGVPHDVVFPSLSVALTNTT
jgi:hypothetical protein